MFRLGQAVVRRRRLSIRPADAGLFITASPQQRLEAVLEPEFRYRGATVRGRFGFIPLPPHIPWYGEGVPAWSFHFSNDASVEAATSAFADRIIDHIKNVKSFDFPAFALDTRRAHD